MKYLSTRGGMPPKTFTEILLGGLATDGGLTISEAYPKLEQGRACSHARHELPRAGIRGDPPLCRRHSRRRSQGHHRQDLHRGDFPQRRNHSGENAGAGAAHPRAVLRPDAGLQGRGDAVARQPVRVCAGQGKRRDQHPRRHFGRYRQRGGIRHARQKAASRCSCSRRWAR